jgi:hypothetical protein
LPGPRPGRPRFRSPPRSRTTSPSDSRSRF